MAPGITFSKAPSKVKTKATMPMHYADIEIINRAKEIVMEVFQ